MTDTTTYIERDKVREIVLETLRHTGFEEHVLKRIDALEIHESPDRFFKPTQETRALLRAMPDIAGGAVDEFISLWESEGSPRRAGSIIAARYLHAAAQLAVFATVCEGRQPDPEIWQEGCREQFDGAVLNVTLAAATVAEKEGTP